MAWTAIGLGLLVAGGLALYITRPWWGRGTASRPALDSARNAPDQTLAEQHEAVLTALRDLDFDHAVGKVAEEDYGPLRQTLLVEAAAIMSQLDEAEVAAEASLEARIEAEILSVRQKLRDEQSTLAPLSNRSCPACGRAARPDDVYCTGCGTRLDAACPECGKTVHPTNRFCAGCGVELAMALAG